MADISWIPGVGYMGGATAPAKKTNSIGYMASSDREVKSQLGKDDFLQLLSAQLQYQNPLEPMNDSDFVAQLAQFSSLESLTNMGSAMSNMVNYQAYSLVGKYVVADTVIDGVKTSLEGTVECVFTQEGVTYAQIGNGLGESYSVPVTSINTVVDKELVSLDKTLLETSNLIGREISAKDYRDGKIVDIKGVVTRVGYENGEIYAFIDDGSESGDKVLVKNIFDIKQVKAPEEIKTPEDEEKVPPPEDEEVPPPGDGEVPPPEGENPPPPEE